jgi:hypothetical protein
LWVKYLRYQSFGTNEVDYSGTVHLP